MQRSTPVASTSAEGGLSLDEEMAREFQQWSTDDSNTRSKLLENEVRMLRNEVIRIQHELNTQKQIIRENTEKTIKFYTPQGSMNFSSLREVPDPALSPNSSYYHFNFKSSTIASVFGGKKPLVYPSRLPLDCGQQPQQQQYRIVYGTDMTMSPQFCDPLTRSSSQSSGFVSQERASQSPTHSNSAFSTPTPPPMPNSGFRKVSGTTSLCSFSLRKNNEIIRPTQYDTLSYIGQCGSFAFDPRTQHFAGIRTENRIFGQSPEFSRESLPQMRNNDCYSAPPFPIKNKGNSSLCDAEKKEDFFSDDEDGRQEPSANSSQVKTSRRLRNLAKGKESDMEDKNNTLGPDNIFVRMLKNSRNILPPTRPRFWLDLFLRLLIFVMVYLLFCFCFVGKWPEPLDCYVTKLTDCYHSVSDFLSNFTQLYTEYFDK